MQHKWVATIERQKLKLHVMQALGRYWLQNRHNIETLPIAELSFPDTTVTPRLVSIRLPDWASKSGVNGELLVPREACVDPDSAKWEQVDWWLASFLMMECWYERVHEYQYKSIHSYSFKLGNWDGALWDRAWVNRIALFLRDWAGRVAHCSSAELFGSVPKAEITLTHDVDAISKTWAIRVKQSLFGLFNSIRAISKWDIGEAKLHLGKSIRFFLSNHDWWTFDQIQAMEKQAGLRGQFNFYADPRRKNFSRWLFDPGYNIATPEIAKKIIELFNNGWPIGLHQSYDSWRAPYLIAQQLRELEGICPGKITSCRQHWLRFSWWETWKAQSKSGLQQDTTLMFNDRPGFRAAAALAWNPWNPDANKPHDLQCLPTIMMDSHFYDYQPVSHDERRSNIAYWLREVAEVGGQAAVLWHPHTISEDYGWLNGFEDLLFCIEEVTS